MTTFPSNIGDDLDAVDGLVPLTLRSRDGTMVDASRSGLPSPISTREAAASNGAYRTTDTRFRVKGGVELTYFCGDFLDAAGRTYVVLDAALKTLSSCWGYVCRDVTIEGPSVVEFVVQRRTGALDAFGSPSYAWSTITPPALGRIQVEGTAAGTTAPIGTIAGARDEGPVTRLYMPAEIDILPGDAILAGGRRYAWTNYAGRGRIGVLPSLDLREIEP